MNECGGRSLGKPLCNAALNKALRTPGGGGENGSASSGGSPEWRRRAGGRREEASAAALSLLLAASAPSPTAATPSPARPQREPEPTRALNPPPSSPAAAGAHSQPGKKLPRWLGVNRHLEQRTKGKESHKAGRWGSRGLVSLTPHPLAKCVCGRNAGGEAGSLPTCSARRTAARAARRPSASVCRTQPSPLQGRRLHAHTHTPAPARPRPRRAKWSCPRRRTRRPSRCSAPAADSRRTCCQDAGRSGGRCSRPWSCAADGGGRSPESPRPPRGGGGGARDPCFT